jgi:hypothetical protein
LGRFRRREEHCIAETASQIIEGRCRSALPKSYIFLRESQQRAAHNQVEERAVEDDGINAEENELPR